MNSLTSPDSDYKAKSLQTLWLCDLLRHGLQLWANWFPNSASTKSCLALTIELRLAHYGGRSPSKPLTQTPLGESHFQDSQKKARERRDSSFKQQDVEQQSRFGFLYKLCSTRPLSVQSSIPIWQQVPGKAVQNSLWESRLNSKIHEKNRVECIMRGQWLKSGTRLRRWGLLW